MTEIIVYSCVFGNYDNFEEFKNPPKEDKFNIKFYLITDNSKIITKHYKVIHKDVLFNSPVKTARYYKINPHLLFADKKNVFYHDRIIKLLQPNALVQRILLHQLYQQHNRISPE
jgi:hypothetical protein